MQQEKLTKTPKAAAIAGIVFSILLLTSFGLLRWSIPSDPLAPSIWLSGRGNTIALALNLIPFAGIAFLWFIGVLRDRLGQREDRFFATVFLGRAFVPGDAFSACSGPRRGHHCVRRQT